ncbi:MAG: sulfurtransferase TusA family protein [Phycisphaerae bacterium]
MAIKQEPILRIPENIVNDTLQYRTKVQEFVKGDHTEVAFRAYRVPMGIYEQRTAGRYMVRIRIAAGLLPAFQARRIAELSKKFGNGIIHITTRQDAQIHNVDIEKTPDVLEGLLGVGLSSRGGGGNTVRNISACPYAGVCQNENFNVAPYAIATTEYLIQNRNSFNLPRKYKIAFSGCSQDCALASVTDLGFFAHKKNGRNGFSVYAGGGLGSNPAVAIKIEDFIDANDIFITAEAVRQLFDQYGDRSNKHRARLRYVLKRLGDEQFVDLYKSYRDKLRREGLDGQIPPIRDIDTYTEKNLEFACVKINLRLGDVSADKLIKIADISEKYAQGLITTTQSQDILIGSVPKGNLEKLHSELDGLGINTAKKSNNIVACTGAETCKLGLCLSRKLAEAIVNKFDAKGICADDNTIKISGCSNSCGHHSIAGIGLQGLAKRVSGRLMPCYDIFIGGRTAEGQAKLAEKIGTAPAKSIPDILAGAFENGTISFEKLKNLTVKYGDFSAEFPEEYFYDYGSNEPFTLAGRGPGECGAGVLDIVSVDINQAKDAIKTAVKNPKDSDDNIYKALLSSARALLIIFGQEPKKDREIFSAFTEYLVKPGWVDAKTGELLNAAIDWKIGDLGSLEKFIPQAEKLVKRIEELYLSLDSNLKFKIEPVAAAAENKDVVQQIRTVDLRGVACPLNFVKAKLELEKIQTGQILEIMLDGGEPVRNVPDSFAEQGQEIVEIKNLGNHFSLKVLRKK